MARIAGVDLPRDKRVEIGLTYVFGIGRSASKKILAKILIFYCTIPYFFGNGVRGLFQKPTQEHRCNLRGAIPLTEH